MAAREEEEWQFLTLVQHSSAGILDISIPASAKLLCHLSACFYRLCSDLESGNMNKMSYILL